MQQTSSREYERVASEAPEGDGGGEDKSRGREELENRLVELIKENAQLEKVSEQRACGCGE